MANKRIIDLSAQATESDAYYVEVDDAGFAATKKMTIGTLLSNEVTARSGMDGAIRSGAGLAGDGSYNTDETSNYLTASEFVVETLGESLFNADIILDRRIKDLQDSINGLGTLAAINAEVGVPKLLNLNSTPLELIAQPGSTKVIKIVDCLAYLDYGTNVIEVGTNTLDVRYSGGAVIGTFSNAFYESGADACQTLAFNSNVAIGINEAVQLRCGANSSNVNPTSKLYVWMLYYIVDLTASTEEP